MLSGRFVVTFDGFFDIAGRADEGLDGASRDQLDIFDGIAIQGIRHRQGQAFADFINGDKTKLPADIFGDGIENIAVDFITGKREIRESVLARQGLDDILFGGELQLHQDLAEQSAFFVLIGHSHGHLLAVDDAAFHKQFSQIFIRPSLEICHPSKLPGHRP